MNGNTEAIAIHTTLTQDEPDTTFVCDFIESDIHRRDAAIAITLDPALTISSIETLMDEPRTPAARHIMTTVLNRAIREPMILDTPRIRDTADRIAHEACHRTSAPLHATAAYLYWTIRDDRQASEQAITALAIDEGTNLAILVVAAIDRGVARH
ncbi:hypothetical protein [Bifidobacterium sp. SO4]|uniref:hypothetical protein n=1 Tax=Bifidobacterium sp. SO4 TaxID=2809030 RepID=UPI001BDCD3DE|nr:hypothetical protein [Bifidobacterium sp. SO4]MBT1171010.1 hypothetical protein [Bifidobacterium sp. SO4]